MTISLTDSPFYLLGVSLRDDRTKIAEAVEHALEDGEIDEQAIIRAQQILMAPKTRLAAELAWLPGIAPARARQLVEASSLKAEVLSELPPLTEEGLLDRIRALAGTNPSHAVVVGFNQRYESLNARCASYRYRQNELDAAKAQVAKQAASLENQGLEIFTQWTAADAPSSPPPPSAPPRLLSATSAADVRIIQQRLVDAKFFTGPVSGVWKDSVGALRQYKTAVGLPGDSKWDSQTQAKLFGGR